MTRITSNRKVSSSALQGLLESPRLRKIDHEGQPWYVIWDLVGILTGSESPDAEWRGMVAREPRLAQVAVRLELDDGSGEVFEAVTLDGLLRIIQSIDAPGTERLKMWLAGAGSEQWRESENPELAWVRLQKLYDQRGFSHAWVQKRLRGMTARQELVREWSRRGVRESEQYRELTNILMQEAFGMDVTAYRNAKQLRRTSENLRDHMTDLELTLTMLGETTAVALHQDHESRDLEQLKADVTDAGQIVRIARQEIERRGGRPVIIGRVGDGNAGVSFSSTAA